MAGFDPEAHLNSLQPIGWKLGLERMHRLTSLLGMPQHRFGSVHVVGTNGKSSVTRMTAALLEAHGVPTGACISPHLDHWAERVLIRGRPIEPAAFAEAVQRTAESAAVVDRTLEPGEAVTQFELAIAASFVALAAARVRAGVVEAGLGGRLDATNVLTSKVTVLTSVGLDHTEWLGETELEIAAEKLAVLRDGSTLVTGRLSEPVRRLAEQTARERGASLVAAPADPGEDLRMRMPGPFQRRNFALACAAAEAFLGGLDSERAREVAGDLAIPGRLERIGEDPPTYLDAAHNPDGAAALAEALPALAGGAAVFACLAVLSDKDAHGIAAALAPALQGAVATGLPSGALAGARPGVHARDPEELAQIFRGAGVEAEAVADPRVALARTRELAAEAGGVALATGSHYLLGALWTERQGQSFSR